MRGPSASRAALRFVLLLGAVSLFADPVYEGSRAILGPYLAALGTGAFAVATVTGFGELLGYALRLVSGRLSDRTRRPWPITISGYAVQMAAVPLLALVGSWPVAAALIVLERAGKAMRNPPRDVMLSHAASRIGYGWAFGLHEALDQAGALLGPLAVATILALREGAFRLAFAALAIPAALTLSLLALARLVHPRPEHLEVGPTHLDTEGLPRAFWVYLGAAALVAAGSADFPLLAFHLQREGVFGATWIPVLYAVAMGASGAGALAVGRLFDRHGIRVLVPLTVVTAAYAPLAFLGGPWAATLGAALWGLGMGVHESVVPAAVAPMVRPGRRTSAYGIFTAGYGLAWFLGSAAMGALYGASLTLVAAFAVALELAAVPLILAVRVPARRAADRTTEPGR